MSEPGGLRIAVLVKQVPDVNAVRVDPSTGEAVLPVERVMNTYDVYAVSEAIGIKERFGGSVTVVTAGPASAREILLRALATGADEAVLVDLPNHNELDSLAVAGILATELERRGFDLVLAGQSTDDYESASTGPQVAELLGWPHVSLVTHVDFADGALRVRRDAEASKETVGLPLPAVLMVLSGRDAEQRYPTLRGMMAAKKKPVHEVSAGQVGDTGRLAWSTPVAVEKQAAGIILEGVAADEAAARLVAWLKEQKLV